MYWYAKSKSPYSSKLKHENSFPLCTNFSHMLRYVWFINYVVVTTIIDLYPLFFAQKHEKGINIEVFPPPVYTNIS